MRVKEDGKSECRTVIVRIGVQTLPRCENTPTSVWSLIAGRTAKPLVVAKKMFRYIDHQIWLKVWQWCVRRHPKKGKRWIRNKYFTTIGMRNWVFNGNDGMNRKYTLFKADSTPIKRHSKIKAIATPYDPKWESYFERRQDYILENAIWGKKRLLAIWRSQGSLCPICRQRITHETGWNVHHKVKKVMGGGEELSNLVLLHPNCHRQLHSCEAGSLKKGL